MTIFEPIWVIYFSIAMLKLGRVQMVVVIINISKIRVTILFWNNAVWLVKTIMWQLQHQNQSALLFLFLNHPRPLFIFVFLMQLIVYKICQWLDSSSLVSKATALPTAQNYFLLDYRSKAMLNLFMTSRPDDLHDQTKISSTNSASRWKSKNIFFLSRHKFVSFLLF